jgi:hypothetical protein
VKLLKVFRTLLWQKAELHKLLGEEVLILEMMISKPGLTV